MKEKAFCTYKDVAKKAGVSITTVFRVANNKELYKVGKNTQRRVRKIIKELNFTPNIIARSLVSRKTFNIAVGIKDLEDIINPYFNQVISGIAYVLEREGYFLQLTRTLPTKKPPLSPYYLKAIQEGRVDGLCLLSEEAPDKDIVVLYERNFPLVLVNRYISGKSIPSILIDNKAGLYTATKELIRLSHRRIAFLAGSFKFQLDKDRLSGYKDALKEANISFDNDLLEEGLFNFNHAYSATERLLKIKPPITGLVASDDVMALAAIRKIQEDGLSVPKDISVIGFNDMILLPTPPPSLTSMRLPLVEMGKLATQILLKLVNKEKLNKKVITFAPQLIKRESIGPNREGQ